LKCGAEEGWKKNQLNRSCEKWRSMTWSQGGKKHTTNNTMDS